MEQLDRENRIPDSCEYTLIGGKSCNLARTPSLLQENFHQHMISSSSSSSKAQRCFEGLRRSSTGGSGGNGDEVGSRSGSSLGHSVVARWDGEDILAWLKEVGFECYQVSFWFLVRIN